MYEIRTFQPVDSEYQALVAVRNAAWPDRMTTVENLKHNDAVRSEKARFRRFVAVSPDGQIVADSSLALVYWSKYPGLFRFNWTIAPENDCTDVNEQIYRHLLSELAASETNPMQILAGSREDKTERLDFLRKKGFTQAMRYPISELRIDTFDFQAFAAAEKRVCAQGIQLLSMARLAESEPHWKQKVYRTIAAISRDIPSPIPVEEWPFEEFEKMLRNPRFRADTWFLAMDGDECVGVSSLWLNPAQPAKISTGLTGVLRSHRRRGIATALKLHAIRHVAQTGGSAIETDNEENNPMYQLNLALGFQPRPAWLDFLKTLA